MSVLAVSGVVALQVGPPGNARASAPLVSVVEDVPSDVAARQAAVQAAVLRGDIAREADSATAREAAAVERASRAERERTLAVLPIDAAVTSPFGHRWGRLHAGLDFGAPVGTPVRAVMAGTVETVEHARGGYGQHVILRLADGTLALYGHLSEIAVEVGAAVAAGTPLGLSGNTGSSTGPHLHFELRGPQGPFDARPWLAARGIVV